MSQPSVFVEVPSCKPVSQEMEPCEQEQNNKAPSGKNIHLTISYDGTHFCGWQRQDKAAAGKPVRTVQGELEKALEKLAKEPVQLIGSGRTDSGVHAYGQAANFYSPIVSMPVESYIPALNSILPKDIRVREARVAEPDFHSRFSAISRTYRYFLYPEATPPAHMMPYVWSLRRRPNLKTLNQMAACLQGELDCTTFAAAGDVSPSKFRYLESAVFYPEGQQLVFEISANAFLWKMVRSIVGSLIYYEAQGKDATFFKEILEKKDRSLAGPTAPPQGLFLWNVSFSGQRRH